MCVRPQTYESESESALLKSLFRGRSGDLENTVFCVLAADGKTKLSRAGRSPSQIFDDADALATFLDEQFKPLAAKAKPIERLPLLDEFALALNVASCDQLPLVILRAKNAKELTALESQLAEVVWAEPHLGRQHYFAFIGELPKTSKGDFGYAKVGTKPASIDFECEFGVTVVDPGTFGLSPKALAHVSTRADAGALEGALSRAHDSHDPVKASRRQHGRDARQQGITWESELPVTDSSNRR